MGDLFEVVWLRDRVVLFDVDEHGDIGRHDMPICPHCGGLMDRDVDVDEHVAVCSGDVN